MSGREQAMTAATFVHPRRELAAFAVTGGDRLTWLNGLVTQEVSKLAPGSGAYALAVGKTGRILAELWVLAGADRALVVAARDRLDALREHLERHLIMEEAEIGPVLPDAIVFVHGPRADEAATAARVRGFDAASIDFTGHGAAVLVGEGLEPGSVLAGAETLDDAAWDGVRIAWGIPAPGVDYGEVMPQEASLERRAVSFGKGCYLGQEAVFMLEKRGQSRRRLVRVALGADPADRTLAAGVEIVLPDGGEVGAITSVTPSGDGGFLALASIKTKHAEPGTAVLAGGHAGTVLGLAGGSSTGDSTPPFR